MIAELESRLVGGTVEEWTARLVEAGVPAGRVNDINQALGLAEELGLEPTMDVGGGHPAQLRHPIRYSGFTPRPPTAPPALNEHGAAVRTWLEP